LRSKQLFSELKKIQNQYDFIQDVRGAGLMIGLEFRNKKSSQLIGPEIARLAKQKGLMLMTTSAFDCLRLIPPLTISEQEVEIALDILKQCFQEVNQAQ
jgi:4-aminobutyrate aminotransferase-like enzyme